MVGIPSTGFFTPVRPPAAARGPGHGSDDGRRGFATSRCGPPPTSGATFGRRCRGSRPLPTPGTTAVYGVLPLLPDRQATAPAAAPRAASGHPVAGTEAPHRAIARPGSPLRELRGDGDGRVRRGSPASSGRLAPSAARDAPGRTGRSSPGSGSFGPDGATPAVAPGDRPRPGSDLHHPPLLAVPHHHSARVARQPPRRSRGNVAPLFQHGLAELLRIRQDRGVHMDHHLTPLTRGRASASACCCARVGASAAGSDAGGTTSLARRFWYSVSRAASRARRSSAPPPGSDVRTAPRCRPHPGRRGAPGPHAAARPRALRNGERVISCAQDGSVHGHSVEELAAWPVGPAPWPSET